MIHHQDDQARAGPEPALGGVAPFDMLAKVAHPSVERVDLKSGRAPLTDLGALGTPSRVQAAARSVRLCRTPPDDYATVSLGGLGDRDTARGLLSHISFRPPGA